MSTGRATVGIDLDGVLGDQIVGVLPRIRQRLGVALSYDDLTEFRMQIGSTDLAEEIQLAQLDSSYLLEMPVHDGAVELVDELRARYRLVLVTARPEAVRDLTVRWLDANGFKFDQIVNAQENGKSIYGADVLVDDYTGNVAEFVHSTDGVAVLVDRPWNRSDRHRLAPALRTGRVKVARRLPEIPGLIEESLLPGAVS